MQPVEWNTVVDEVGPRLFRYFRFRGAQDLASDLTQEAFIRLLSKMAYYDDARGSIVAFALGIAYHIWLEHQRKHKEFENIDGHAEIPTNENLLEKYESFEEGQRLRMAVASLPSAQRDILYFYFDEELTTYEISKILEMPEGTVKSHIHRAKASLRRILTEELK